MEVLMWITFIGNVIAGLWYGWETHGVTGAIGGLVLGAIAGMLINIVWWLLSTFQEIRNYSKKWLGKYKTEPESPDRAQALNFQIFLAPSVQLLGNKLKQAITSLTNNDAFNMEKILQFLSGKRKHIIISLIAIALLIGVIVVLQIVVKPDVDFSIVPVEGSNGEYQYIDVSQKGKIVINPQFGEAHIFRGGLALVKSSGRNGKYGYIDKKGKYVIAPTYDYAQDFSEGVAWVQMENQPPMLIDNKGKILLRIDSLTQAYPFASGMARVVYYSQGQAGEGFVNKNGEIIIAAAEGERIGVINEGLYAFKSKKWGFKNKQGEVVINEQFDSVGVFFDGVAVVKAGDKWGGINKKGEYIVNPQYDELIYDSDGLFVVNVGDKHGWINKKGDVTINPQFDGVSPFYGNKLAPVQMGSRWAYVDRKGQVVINPQFEMALSFFGDYAPIFSNRKIGFINKKGDYVVQPLYSITNFSGLMEYVYALDQNSYGLNLTYYETAVKELSGSGATGHFKPYERLKERKKEYSEREREKAMATAEAKRAEAKASTSSFTDPRDGVTYKYVKIGNQVWMAENLNYAEGKCYEDNPANCQKYGRLFSWADAKKICPAGWHLPSNAEWDALYRFVDGNSDSESPYKSETAGKVLKAVGGWNLFNEESGGGEDIYGFAALPGGNNFLGTHDHIGNNGYWWSASEYESDKAYYRFMLNQSTVAGWNKNSKKILLSVRCVRD
jgi:uncharacterized protein (TIGR02145 family)